MKHVQHHLYLRRIHTLISEKNHTRATGGVALLRIMIFFDMKSSIRTTLFKKSVPSKLIPRVRASPSLRDWSFSSTRTPSMSTVGLVVSDPYVTIFSAHSFIIMLLGDPVSSRKYSRRYPLPPTSCKETHSHLRDRLQYTPDCGVCTCTICLEKLIAK